MYASTGNICFMLHVEAFFVLPRKCRIKMRFLAQTITSVKDRIANAANSVVAGFNALRAGVQFNTFAVAA